MRVWDVPRGPLLYSAWGWGLGFPVVLFWRFPDVARLGRAKWMGRGWDKGEERPKDREALPQTQNPLLLLAPLEEGRRGGGLRRAWAKGAGSGPPWSPASADVAPHDFGCSSQGFLEAGGGGGQHSPDAPLGSLGSCREKPQPGPQLRGCSHKASGALRHIHRGRPVAPGPPLGLDLVPKEPSSPGSCSLLSWLSAAEPAISAPSCSPAAAPCFLAFPSFPPHPASCVVSLC